MTMKNDKLVLYKIRSGDTYDSVASTMQKMYPGAFKSQADAKSILLANNGVSISQSNMPNHRGYAPTSGEYLNLSPYQGTCLTKRFKSALNRVPANVMFQVQRHPQALPYMLWTLKEAQSAGWDIGRLSNVGELPRLRISGNGASLSMANKDSGRLHYDDEPHGLEAFDVTVTGSGAFAEAGDRYFGMIRGLYGEIFIKTIKRFGKKVAFSKPWPEKVEGYIRGLPEYEQLQELLHSMPMRVAQRFGFFKFSADEMGNIHRMRRLVFWPLRKMNRTWEGPIEDLGRISRFAGKVSFHGTWIIPTMVGLYQVAEAPSGQRADEGFKVTGGILGGYAGSEVGAAIGVEALMAIGISSGGVIFVVAAVCAGVGAYYGSKYGGNKMSWLYNLLSNR